MEDKGQRYDFDRLVDLVPELGEHLTTSPRGDQTIDFANQLAVRLLNEALIKSRYGLQCWQIPDEYLCPAVPGRQSYLEVLDGLLSSLRKGRSPRGPQVSGLDIGTGASLIYPIIGRRLYRWQMTGTDISEIALESAQQIIDQNGKLLTNVALRPQNDSRSIFHGVIRPEDYFDFSMCNPPFYSSQEEAAQANARKVANLAKNQETDPQLNFGGQSNELWTDGGEVAFISQMISESAEYPKSCLFYTSLVSREASLAPLGEVLESTGVEYHDVLDSSIGHKRSRILVWSFLTEKQRKIWAKFRW